MLNMILWFVCGILTTNKYGNKAESKISREMSKCVYFSHFDNE